MITVICHIYNEEILLPYWLKHHVNIFDHGVIIDYASTDTSLDIVRQLAPNWKIVQSKHQTFDSFLIDQEVMEIERTISDWKMTLNCTEFILKPDLSDYIRAFDVNFGNVIKAIKTNGVIIVEKPDQIDNELRDEPLIFQKTYGFFETDKCPIIVRKKPSVVEVGCQRQRLIHKHSDGAYGPGRHFTSRKFYSDPSLLLAWFGLAPFKINRQRKMQIYDRMSEKDKKRGEGTWVIAKPEEFDHFYECVLPYAEDLKQKNTYLNALRSFECTS